MKEKKASAGIIIGAIFAIMIIGLVITVLILVAQKGFSKNSEEVEIPKLELFLKAIDVKTKESVDAEYFIDYNKNVFVSKGQLEKDTWTRVPELVPEDELIHVRCWSDNHYLTNANKVFSQTEKDANKSKRTCEMMPVGEISVKCDGDLSNENNIISCNVTSNGWYSKLSACFEWSAGIISVVPENTISKCEKGSWKNYTAYYPENNSYDYLPENYYICDGKIEKCEYVRGSNCKPYSMKIPESKKGKVDSCHYFGKSLNDESYIVNLEVKTTPIKNNLDFIRIIFMDKDRRFDENEQMWVWMPEKNGINLGAEDTEVVIRYNG